MKKPKAAPEDTLRPEYRREDLGKGVRGKHYNEYIKGTNLVLLSPDVPAAGSEPKAIRQFVNPLLSTAELRFVDQSSSTSERTCPVSVLDDSNISASERPIMSTKKFQIFVSSTYKDLLAERQAVVEAILMAGHIPAGMELFAAGDKSQLEAIRRWIKESDVFMVILGGRYGSIEDGSGKSYVQLEYEYASELSKPIFAAVISDNYLERKIKDSGRASIETDHPDLYRSLKKMVMSKMCRFFDDAKDLKLVVHESIPEVTRERRLSGWIRGDEALDPKKVLEEVSQAQAENNRLTKRISELELKAASDTYAGYSFEELLAILQEERLDTREASGGKVANATVLRTFYAFADSLTTGVANMAGMSEWDYFAFYELAPKLAVYGLTETKNVNNRGIQRFQTSALGNRFLARAKPLLRAEIASEKSTRRKKKSKVDGTPTRITRASKKSSPKP